ncbi:MAG: type II toxin-antitoxin system MqsR family toxin [Leptospira sp.]|nr:type II toxin-antitoxin system MqsR family toxin [Leptospira sp.]
MEKKVCHYTLNRIKKLIRENRYSITKSALKTAVQDFSFLEEDILNEILVLENDDFYKSMTSHNFVQK